MQNDTAQDTLREEALLRLKKKRDLTAHAMAYVAINGFLVVIWATVTGGFFWPVFPLFGWGIGLFFHAWDVYKGEPTEEDISREMERIARRRQ
jgi:hypothetical protein